MAFGGLVPLVPGYVALRLLETRRRRGLAVGQGQGDASPCLLKPTNTNSPARAQGCLAEACDPVSKGDVSFVTR